MAKAKVDWYANDVIMLVDGATDEFLAKLAFQIQGQARINIQTNKQIDTGFMLNSVYVVTPEKSDYSERKAEAEIRNPKANMAPQVRLPHGAKAAVCAGAEYAIYQEARKSFLYRALEQVSNEAEGVLKPIAREKFGD